MDEVEGFCRTFGGHSTLGPAVRLLGKTVRRLGEVAAEMAKRSQTDPLQWASSTYPALVCFGDVTLCWRLLDMARIASEAMDKAGQNAFYAGKVYQATYRIDTTLPLTLARLDTCLRPGREVVEIPDESF
jgi:hypothetical protein